VSAFDTLYAGAYDALYGDKDYSAECDMLEKVFETFSRRDVTTVLDLGCGTGNHALRLAERGYSVTGVDSSGAMLAGAEAKAKRRSLEVEFRRGDIRSLDLGREFDAVLMMFAVLGYQVGDGDVAGALASARRHLRPDGLLVFDCWYGPAVLAQRPGDREKVVRTRQGKVVRNASGSLDVGRNVCVVRYRVQEYANDRLVGETEEEHRMRYFFAPELERFLLASGFRVLRMGAFPSYDSPPDAQTWNILVVASAGEIAG